MDNMCNCGHAATPSKLTTGYAKDALGYTYCYACAAESDRQELLAGHPIVAYLGERAHAHGPYRLTTWPGEYLGYVGVTERPAAHKRYVAGYVDGIEVYGSGPLENGDYVTLHPRKTTK